MYDAVIVGGGTAGLSAALVLGRSRRRTLVLSSGPPRNAPADAAHGMFTRDGTPPLELLRIGREQLLPYQTVEVRDIEVVVARQLAVDEGFAIGLADGSTVLTRSVVLATGAADVLPDIPGFRERWGQGVYHCPYCHGWEVRDEPLGVYARGASAMHLAPLLRNWSRDLVLLTDGLDVLTDDERATLEQLGIDRRDDQIDRLEGGDDGFHRVVFTSGDALTLRGIFAHVSQQPRTALAEQLSCELASDGPIPGRLAVDDRGQTTVPNVYAVGDVAVLLQQVVTAAASGAMVGAMVNHALVQREVLVIAR